MSSRSGLQTASLFDVIRHIKLPNDSPGGHQLPDTTRFDEADRTSAPADDKVVQEVSTNLENVLLERASSIGSSEATPAPPKTEDHVISNSTICGTCQLKFEDVASQRAHFRTDFHRLNLKLKIAGKPPISEDQAADLLLGENDDMESLSGSDTESESEDDSLYSEQQLHPIDRASGLAAVAAHQSMYVGLKMPDGSVAWGPKATVLDAKQDTLDIASLQKSDVWVVLLHGAGHFSGLVVKGGTNTIASKSFHRYVVRRGQGKAQSANDNSNGKANSAGAQIRRHNEKMLREEIGELLKSWSTHLKCASRVFVSISKTNQSLLFQEPQVLSKSDPRIRKVPFPTRRPTLKEAQAVAQKLAAVQVQSKEDYLREEEEEERRVKESQAAKRKQANLAAMEPSSKGSSAAVPAPESSPVVVPDTPELANLLEACKSGELHLVIMALATAAEFINVPSASLGGVTALHVAAESGNENVVKLLLENGANPEKRTVTGKLPYHCGVNFKACKDAFRRYRGEHPSQWDYNASGIPEPKNEISEEEKKKRQREKKKRAAERKKAAKAAEKAAKEEKAKEEQAILDAAPACACCNGKLAGKPSTWFQRLDAYYCSQSCLQRHRRELAAEAAERRAAASRR